MNVIVANKNSSVLNSLDIDIIKSINGEFTVDDIVQLFSNFFFGKMIIDKTAIKDIYDQNKVNYLVSRLDPNKIIIYDVDKDEKLSYILQKSGIYSIASNKDEVIRLIYRSKGDNGEANKVNNLFNLSNLSNSDVEEVEYTGTNYDTSVDYNVGSINVSNHGNELINITSNNNKRIIAFNNITNHAGATSLVYMLVKDLSNLNVMGIELKRHDTSFFGDNRIISASIDNLEMVISNNKDKDFIFIDANDEDVEKLCDLVIYLIEPSTIKLNKLFFADDSILNELRKKKLVLNKSLLSSNDVNIFNKELGVSVLYNLCPLNDKVNNEHILREFIYTITR